MQVLIMLTASCMWHATSMALCLYRRWTDKPLSLSTDDQVSPKNRGAKMAVTMAPIEPKMVQIEPKMVLKMVPIEPKVVPIEAKMVPIEPKMVLQMVPIEPLLHEDPPITIIRPLCGLGFHIKENLEALMHLDWAPGYEVRVLTSVYSHIMHACAFNAAVCLRISNGLTLKSLTNFHIELEQFCCSLTVA